MLSNFHFPSYFSKSIREEIGELYVSIAISGLASAMAMLFEPIFLYVVLGFSVPQVLLFMAVTYATYILIIPLGGKVASLYGYKHAVAMAAPFQVLYWMLLLVARDNHPLAYLAAVALAAQKALYWPGFHALMARYTDHEQVGREFGVSNAIVSVVQIIGPFIGGVLSQNLGMTATFVTAALIYCGSVLPLFKSKEVFVPKEYYFKDTLRMYWDYPKKFVGYLGFGEELLVLTVWPIFIYIVVKNFENTGLLATIASFAAAVLAVIVGKITDQYTKRLLIRLGAFLTSLVWFARLIVTNVWNALAIDTLSRTSKEMCFIPISTVTYIRAENTHVVPYAVFFEQSLAVGKLSACILGIFFFSLFGTISMSAGFMALFILAGIYSLLYMFI